LKYFITGHILLIDETFEMNKLSMILLMIVRITATNKNFSAAYNFIKSEAAVSFNFLFNSFKHFVFNDDITEV
jgi:adenine specific DNA methylase Mod